MTLKKVTYLAAKFQAKLAQRPGPRGFAPGELPSGGAANPFGKDAPFGGTAGDPLDMGKKELGAFTDVSEYNKPKNPAKPSGGKPQAAFSVGEDAVDSFADIKKMLDVGVPGTKGVLRLTVMGNSVGVAYNKNRWNVHPKEVKRLLTNALSPTYIVGEPVGYMNPDWSMNTDPEHTFTY